MSTPPKNVIATGASSGLVSHHSFPQCTDKRHLTAIQGLEVVKQLLQQPEPHNFILGVRDIERTRAAYKDAGLDNSKHTLHLLQLDLSDLRSVQLFVQKALAQLGPNKLDLLFLNAGVLDDASGPGPHGSQWCQGYVVNHLGKQHFDFGSQKKITTIFDLTRN